MGRAKRLNIFSEISIVAAILISCTSVSAQCGIVGMQPSMFQDASFPIENTSTSTLAVRILDGNYLISIGLEDSTPGGPNNVVAFSPNETGSAVSDAITILGIYEVEIKNPGQGCIDTVQVAVLSPPCNVIAFPGQMELDFPESEQVKRLNLESTPDIRIWEYAKSNGYTIVTFNADFSEISNLNGDPPKIIWLRFGNNTSNYVVEILNRKRDQIEDYLEGKVSEKLSCLEII